MANNMLLWIIIGVIWNSINLWLLFLIVKVILSWHKNRGRKRIILGLFLFLKFPLLYTAGYLFLTYGNPSSGWLMLGFSLPLLTAFFWIIGRLIRSAEPGFLTPLTLSLPLAGGEKKGGVITMREQAEENSYD